MRTPTRCFARVTQAAVVAGLALGAAVAPVASPAAVAATGSVAPSPSSGRGPHHTRVPGTVVLTRGGHARSFRVSTPGGEAIARFTARALGADWSVAGREGAVLEVAVDGRRVTDVVLPTDTATPRSIGLGTLTPGRHTVTVRLDDRAGARGVRRVTLTDLDLGVAGRGTREQAVLAHAPIVVGRALPALGSPLQNATTDTPLLAWHEEHPAATAGHTIVEYSVVWSNEDGGTDTPALMARWGRTTDIEWIYRVELDAHGRRVPGSDVYQAPDHATLHFTGTYEGTHPVLQTCTSNNNMCDHVTLPAGESGLRFLLAADETLQPDRARESIMDAHPWSYQVMAAEMTREKKVEQTPSPATPAMSDQRDYAFVEFRKKTGAPVRTGSDVGVSLGIRLKGDPTLYRSDHGNPDWTVTRDAPAATTVELPAGTTAADIASVEVIRQSSGAIDNGAPVTVLGVNRAFFLGADRLPGPSVLAGALNVTLTQAAPTAVIWSATS